MWKFGHKNTTKHKRKTVIGNQDTLSQDWRNYWRFLWSYVRSRVYIPFSKFEGGKDVVVGALYKKRGKYAQPLTHLSIVGLAFLIVLLGPVIFEQAVPEGVGSGTTVLTVRANDETSFYTLRAEEVQQLRGGEIVTHIVEEGETLQAIAERYSLEVNTIVWENDLASEKTAVKAGDELRILPVDGVNIRVAKGETIYTIARKYGLKEEQAQMIVDYPFNEFLNDETFTLAVGQNLIVPYGIKPKASTGTVANTYSRAVFTQTPDAGTVAASGQFIWPASGGISQGYIPGIHRAIDIANRGAGPILAADGGTVVAAGWDSSGYGNRVIVDHGNGFSTLYAHMSALQVSVGQAVDKGGVVGQMGSTGRSTGIHLHFEIRSGGALLNPLQFLQ